MTTNQKSWALIALFLLSFLTGLGMFNQGVAWTVSVPESTRIIKHFVLGGFFMVIGLISLFLSGVYAGKS